MTAGLASDGLPPLREVVQTYGLEPKKSLGQNFLFDLNLTGKIARAAGPLDGVLVFEVGPGPGGLTRALLAQGADVIAVERDARCIEALNAIRRRYPGRLTVIEADAMTIDVGQITQEQRSLRIVANLPYNVGTALLTRWIEAPHWPPPWDRLTLMFQREVAERIVATPRQRADYGRLAVLCGWRTQARILFDVPPSAFTPPPKVTSSIVELVPRAVPLPCSAPLLSAVTLACFGQRRKMLRQSLRSLPVRNGRSVEPSALLDHAGLEGTRRPEEIDVAGFVALTQSWQQLTDDPVAAEHPASP